MPTPEGLVLSKSKDSLKKLEEMGWVTHWSRITVGLFYTQWGSMIKVGKEFEPDLWVFVPIDKVMWVMFFDTKKSSGGNKKQDVFFNKFNGFNNVICSYITDAKQIKYLIQKVKGITPNSSKYNKKVEDSFINLPTELI